jgi:hypothetical protein
MRDVVVWWFGSDGTVCFCVGGGEKGDTDV